MYITLKSVQTVVIFWKKKKRVALKRPSPPASPRLPTTYRLKEVGSGDTNSLRITILPYSIHNKLYSVWFFSLVKKNRIRVRPFDSLKAAPYCPFNNAEHFLILWAKCWQTNQLIIDAYVSHWASAKRHFMKGHLEPRGKHTQSHSALHHFSNSATFYRGLIGQSHTWIYCTVAVSANWQVRSQTAKWPRQEMHWFPSDLQCAHTCRQKHTVQKWVC